MTEKRKNWPEHDSEQLAARAAQLEMTAADERFSDWNRGLAQQTAADLREELAYRNRANRP